MYNDISKPPPPLPSADLQQVAPGISLLAPLTRRGHGPGIIILTAETNEPLAIKEGVPSHLQKWAEEGYTVANITPQASDPADSLKRALDALNTEAKCDPKGTVGIVSYLPTLWSKIAPALSSFPEIKAATIFSNAPNDVSINIPILQHLAGEHAAPAKQSSGKTYGYAKASSYEFATPFSSSFHYNTEALAHTRTLQFLKPIMNGPYFDLESIWDEHCYYEFADRSVEHTMSTMVQEPYVNHIPTMTGGIGRAALTDFYRQSFIFSNSADTDLELLSRTLGIDRIIDEFIFKFTHDRVLDWLMPGVPPTFVKVEVPFTAVVNVRGDRLYHEHIGWDQASVLRQVGLLPEYLPFPYPVGKAANGVNGDGANGVNGTNGANGHHKETVWEYRVPVAGIETAQKMRDRNGLPSNAMLDYKPRQV